MEVKNQPLLSVVSLTKSYGAQRPALSDVSFELEPGEVLCVVGENGAGKSTLIKILSGAVDPDSGSIGMGSKTWPSLKPNQAMALGIATIYQDIELIESLTVADNIFLGAERTTAGRIRVDARSQERAAKEYLERLHMSISPSALVESLSSAEKQNLQIVKALHQEARILIMDEPTSSLGYEEKRSLMALVKELKQRGLAIIYISHYFQEVFEIGDKILILKDGERVGLYDRQEVDAGFVIRQMVGREASAFYHRERFELGAVRLEVKGLNGPEVAAPVSFEVRRGEIFGLGGLVGSGRSELVGLLYGLGKSSQGEVLLDGKSILARSPAEAIRNGVRFITEDRHKYAMFGPRSVRENVGIAHNEFAGGPLVDLGLEARLTDEMVKSLHIAGSPRQSVESLSGGNQQKVIIARWILEKADVYIFDEPTKGVDVGAKEEIYKLMVDMARSGLCLVMVSSDMPELLSMSDRIGIMRAGQLVKIVDNVEISEHDLIQEFLGT